MTQKRVVNKQKFLRPNFIKMYNQGIGEFGLEDQRTTIYHFDNKSTIRVYLHIPFYRCNLR